MDQVHASSKCIECMHRVHGSSSWRTPPAEHEAFCHRLPHVMDGHGLKSPQDILDQRSQKGSNDESQFTQLEPFF